MTTKERALKYPQLKSHTVASLPVEEILALEEFPKDDETSVYLSGSLVEGYGNSGSDIDVFVLTNDKPKGQLIIDKKRFAISIHFIDTRRVDFEYWPAPRVLEIADRLRQIKPGTDFVAEKLDPVEELFIHRLKIGIPLWNSAKFADWQAKFDFSLFQKYLVQQAVHRIDGALEDLCGMLSDNDLDVALFRARDLVNLTIDAYCHYAGNTNPLPKWRVKILESFATDQFGDEVRSKFWQFQFPDVENLRTDSTAGAAYIESCIEFANRVTNWIQR